MRRNSSKQRAGLLGAEDPRQSCRRQHGRRPESGQGQRMGGHPQQRSHDVLGQCVEMRCGTGEQRPPPRTVAAQGGSGLLDGAIQHSGVAVVERVDTVDVGQPPLETVTFQTEFAQHG